MIVVMTARISAVVATGSMQLAVITVHPTR
jgi:hypothetical protein